MPLRALSDAQRTNTCAVCLLPLPMFASSAICALQYFDSAFYFGADTVRGEGITFTNALAGVTHFERTARCEYISAYRFHANDPLVFDDGGGLVWRVGEGHQPMASRRAARSGALRGGATSRGSSSAPRIFTKCGNQYPSQEQAASNGRAPWQGSNALSTPQRTISAVNVSTYAWVYVNV